MDVIQYGGLEVLEKAQKVHAKDDFIAMTIPKLIKYIRGIFFYICIMY